MELETLHVYLFKIICSSDLQYSVAVHSSTLSQAAASCEIPDVLPVNQKTQSCGLFSFHSYGRR